MRSCHLHPQIPKHIFNINFISFLSLLLFFSFTSFSYPSYRNIVKWKIDSTEKRKNMKRYTTVRHLSVIIACQIVFVIRKLFVLLIPLKWTCEVMLLCAHIKGLMDLSLDFMGRFSFWNWIFLVSVWKVCKIMTQKNWNCLSKFVEFF